MNQNNQVKSDQEKFNSFKEFREQTLNSLSKGKNHNPITFGIYNLKTYPFIVDWQMTDLDFNEIQNFRLFK